MGMQKSGKQIVALKLKQIHERQIKPNKKYLYFIDLVFKLNQMKTTMCGE